GGGGAPAPPPSTRTGPRHPPSMRALLEPGAPRGPRTGRGAGAARRRARARARRPSQGVRWLGAARRPPSWAETRSLLARGRGGGGPGLGGGPLLQLLRLVVGDEAAHDLLQVAVEHRLQAVEGQADAVVGDPVLVEVVGADLLAAVAAAHLALAVAGDGLLLLL